MRGSQSFSMTEKFIKFQNSRRQACMVGRCPISNEAKQPYWIQKSIGIAVVPIAAFCSEKSTQCFLSRRTKVRSTGTMVPNCFYLMFRHYEHQIHKGSQHTHNTFGERVHTSNGTTKSSKSGASRTCIAKADTQFECISTHTADRYEIDLNEVIETSNSQ